MGSNLIWWIDERIAVLNVLSSQQLLIILEIYFGNYSKSQFFGLILLENTWKLE